MRTDRQTDMAKLIGAFIEKRLKINENYLKDLCAVKFHKNSPFRDSLQTTIGTNHKYNRKS